MYQQLLPTQSFFGIILAETSKEARMYQRRLSEFRELLAAYHEATLNASIPWRLPTPVPTPRRSARGDYLFSWGEYFDLQRHPQGSRPELLGVFVKHPSHSRRNFSDTESHVLVRMPYGTVDDMILVFRTTIPESDSGRVVDRIQVIKGIGPEHNWQQDEAEQFNSVVNRAMWRLFLAAARDAHIRAVMNAELELQLLE